MPVAGSGNTHVYIQWTRAITVYLGCGLANCNYRGMKERCWCSWQGKWWWWWWWQKKGQHQWTTVQNLLSPTIIYVIDNVFYFLSLALVWISPCISTETLSPSPNEWLGKLESIHTRFTPKEKRIDNTGCISVDDSIHDSERGRVANWLTVLAMLHGGVSIIIIIICDKKVCLCGCVNLLDQNEGLREWRGEG